MEKAKIVILLIVLTGLVGGMSLSSATATYEFNTTNDTNETYDVSPIPTGEQNSTPSVAPTETPEISISPVPSITATPSAAPSEAPSGGTEEKKENKTEDKKGEVLPTTTFAQTGGSALNLILGLGLSLLTFGGAYHAKRNIS